MNIMHIITVKRIPNGDLRPSRFKFHSSIYRVNMEVESEDLSRKTAVSILQNLGYEILGVAEWIGDKLSIATTTHRTFSQAKRERVVEL
jgi:hypothetical protein